jgi:1,4-dihydroxy-2-naphthoate octaprenyltransferase
VASIVSLLVARLATWPGAVMLALMLVLSWSYSSPPLRLHTRGFGEPTVWLVVPVMTPLSGFILQAHTLTALPVLIVLPLSLLLMTMLLTLEFPDEKGDRRTGKISWTVLWGTRNVASACMLLVVAAFAGRFASEALGVPPAIARGWLWLLPLALFQTWRLLAGDWKHPRVWTRLEFGSVALFFLAVVADLVGLYRTG